MNHTYELLKSGLDVSALRQETISSNIANVNTPNYKVNKVAFETHLKDALHETGLHRTQNGHMHPSDNNPLNPKVEKRITTNVQDNGNNVDIDYEMAELASNNLYYDALVSQVNAKYNMMRSVIR